MTDKSRRHEYLPYITLEFVNKVNSPSPERVQSTGMSIHGSLFSQRCLTSSTNDVTGGGDDAATTVTQIAIQHKRINTTKTPHGASGRPGLEKRCLFIINDVIYAALLGLMRFFLSGDFATG